MVVISPRWIPNASFSTLTIGARQLVVQDALEMIECAAGSYASSFTPSTRVMSSFLAGAEMITFLAPPSMCLRASSALVKNPVDSSTMSTPRSFQGSLAGSRSASPLIVLPPTSMPSSVCRTCCGSGPRMLSYFSRCAMVATSPRSLKATISMSCRLFCAARQKLRPILPKPFTPTRMVTQVSSVLRPPAGGDGSGRALPLDLHGGDPPAGRGPHQAEHEPGGLRRGGAHHGAPRVGDPQRFLRPGGTQPDARPVDRHRAHGLHGDLPAGVPCADAAVALGAVDEPDAGGARGQCEGAQAGHVHLLVRAVHDLPPVAGEAGRALGAALPGKCRQGQRCGRRDGRDSRGGLLRRVLLWWRRRAAAAAGQTAGQAAERGHTGDEGADSDSDWMST